MFKQKTDKTKILNSGLCLFFILFLFSMLLFVDKRSGEIALSYENRFKNNFPKFYNEDGTANKLITKDLENWIDDNIALKENFLNVYRYIEYKYLGEYPYSGNVLLGKENWLYLFDDYVNKTFRAYQGTTFPTEEILESYRKTAEEATKRYNDRNIHYTVMVWPDKACVYPEYILDTVIPSEVNYYQFLNEKLANSEKYNFYIPYDELVKAKSDGLVYRKAFDGSHWNNKGAFIGYTSLMNQIKKDIPDIKILTEDDFIISPLERRTVILDDNPIIEMDYQYSPKYDISAVSDKSFFDGIPSIDEYKSYNYFYNDNRSLPKCIIVGDSFTWMFFLEYIAESFSDLVFIHRSDIGNLELLINKIDPDIIVNTLVGVDAASILYDMPPEINLPKNLVSDAGFFYDIAIGDGNIENFIDISDYSSEKDIEINGWALDPVSEKPGSQLYIEIEDTIHPISNYGLERHDLANYFSNYDLINTGFKVNLNIEKLIRAKKFRFYLVSFNGETVYETRWYEIKQ